MQGATQAPDGSASLALALFRPETVLLVLSLSLLAGCTSATLGSVQPDVDTTFITGSIPAPKAVSATYELGPDKQAILGALSASLADGDAVLPLLWTSDEAGARGYVTEFVARDKAGKQCWALTTTRESFDGVNLYNGTACKDDAGRLRMDAFERI